MVGVCGVIDGNHPIDEMAEPLVWTGDERVSRFEDSSVRIRGFTHRSRDRRNPGRARERDALVWVWGNVLGYRRNDTYEPRTVEAPAATYCARLYDEDGIDFVRRLNGDFVGLVYDREQDTVSVFTDRLGTWPLYHVETDDGAVVFSSHIQSLDRYPPVTLSFDEEYVVQHLSWRGGPGGIKTPLRGVEAYQPGAITTCDLTDGTTDVETYWRPTFGSSAEFDDYSSFVDAFVDRFRASVADRTRDRSKRYGILLSGGSDARLVLAALDDDLDVTAFHMADWMSKEARVAERVAMEKGVEFRLLRRDPEYYRRVLDRSPGMWNFQQRFNQAWAEGFAEEIRSEVDVLLTGHFSDTLFKGMFVPTRYLDLGPLGSVPIPYELPIRSLEEYDRHFGPQAPEFVETDVDLSEVLDRNVSLSPDGTVEAYGVEFDSIREFVLGRLHVPATTDPLFRQSLREHLELAMPVYDDRLLDLWTDMPTGYKLRRNVINSAVEALDPDLAEIPHAGSGLALTRSRTAHRLGSVPMNTLRRLSPFEAVPTDRVNHTPWGDHAELIREQSYVEDAIYGSEDLIRSLPFLDWEDVVACHQDHLDGANHTRLLYKLVTFLEAPITRRIAESDSAEGNDPRRHRKLEAGDD